MNHASKQTCGRRFELIPVQDWGNGMLSNSIGKDRWARAGHGLVGQEKIGRSCTHCGSLHPDDLMAKLRDGWELQGSDKAYKWYLGSPQRSQCAKFYTVHLPKAHCIELLAMWANGTLRHSMYVRPWLPAYQLQDAPAWLTGEPA